MFKIEDAEELSALHKIILEGKFRLDPMTEGTAGDPVIAGLSNRLYDELCRAREKSSKGEGKQWQEWRRIRFTEGVHKGNYRGYRNYALIRARRDPLFETASLDEKRALVKCYLSPFTCKESEIEEFLSDMTSEGVSLESINKNGALKGTRLIKAIYCGDDCVQLSLLNVSGGKSYDIFFTGIRSFEIKNEGENSELPLPCVKLSLSSGSKQSIEAVFAEGGSKKTVKIVSEKTYYWE